MKLHWMVAGALLVTGVAFEVSAQTPDYLGHGRLADTFAKLAHSTVTCSRLAFQVDADGVRALGDRAIVDAVRDGITPQMAEQTLVAAMRQEAARMEYLLDVGAGSEPAFREFIDFWHQRCTELANNDFTGQYIRRGEPETEAAAYEAAIEQMRSAFTGSTRAD